MEELSKLARYDLNGIVRLNDPYFKFDVVAPKLETLKQSAVDVIENAEFWNELPESIKELIKSRVTELLQILDEIVLHRDEAAWLTAQYESRISIIGSIYELVYRDFVRGVREYKNSLETTLEQSRKELAKLKSATKRAEGSAKSVGELAGDKAVAALHEHFESAVSGIVYQAPPKGSWRNLFNLKIRVSERWKFFAQGNRGYEASARKWVFLVVASIVSTSWFGTYLFREVDFTKVTLEEVLARALLLAAPAYAIRFCVRNYNASKHLAATNRHRAVVLRTLLAFLSRTEIGDQVREQIVVEAARQVFATEESGYITRKDGAGSSEPIIELPFKPTSTH